LQDVSFDHPDEPTFEMCRAHVEQTLVVTRRGAIALA
jgi:hypothetical protein